MHKMFFYHDGVLRKCPIQVLLPCTFCTWRWFAGELRTQNSSTYISWPETSKAARHPTNVNVHKDSLCFLICHCHASFLQLQSGTGCLSEALCTPKNVPGTVSFLRTQIRNEMTWRGRVEQHTQSPTWWVENNSVLRYVALSWAPPTPHTLLALTSDRKIISSV